VKCLRYVVKGLSLSVKGTEIFDEHCQLGFIRNLSEIPQFYTVRIREQKQNQVHYVSKVIQYNQCQGATLPVPETQGAVSFL
jgi:hypothetical protein